MQILGEQNLAALIDLTEKAIHLTDDLIIEFNDFITNFHIVAKDSIDTKKVKRYGPVLSFDTEGNVHLKKMIERTPEVNFQRIADIFGTSVDEASRRYHNGY